jgi:iduronate 2-sulfatase
MKFAPQAGQDQIMKVKQLLFSLALCVLVTPAFAKDTPATSRPNILFIAVDDLRLELVCYGARHIKSPNIDRLASEGLRFERAYCQWAVCGVSRASLLTGMRPDAIKGAGMSVHFRKYVPDVVTLPQCFKQHGYYSQELGKIFHGGFVTDHYPRKMADPPSWSSPSWTGSPRYYFSPEGVAAARASFVRGYKKKLPNLNPDDWVNHIVFGGATEAPDVADDVLYDGQLTEQAILKLRELKDRQFFLAVGFLKPHLPFIAPKKYWDMYDAETIELASNLKPPKDSPQIAGTNWGELRNYSDMPKKGPVTTEQARRLRHGYYACVSYVDALIGRLLGELERLELADNTIVILWGDHGWKLGEYGMWSKHTNFELDTHVPLIVRAPGMAASGQSTSALTELVDIYPTLVELAGLPRPDHLEGTSFAPLLDNPNRAWKSAAFSQFPRGAYMGRSIRSDRFRFTRWEKTGNPKQADEFELYDHQNDPQENFNLANRPENAELVKRLTEQLAAGWGEALPPQTKNPKRSK